VHEIRIMAVLAHPNVLTLLGVSKASDGELLLISEYMAGGSLADFIVASTTKAVEVPLKLKLKLCREICYGMHYLVLNRVIHRYDFCLTFIGITILTT